MDGNRLQNHLLNAMADADFALVEPHLTLVAVGKLEELALPQSRIRSVWFPLSGIISVVATTASGVQAEVAIVGREGMFPVAPLHGVEVETMRIVNQVAGKALRLPAATLRTLLAASPGLNAHLLDYAQTFMLQVAGSALAYATRTIEARLARWLLMSLDRLDSREVPMTHEALSLMLGVRRAGVTVAIQSLETKGAVTGRRAAIRLVDRAVLTGIAGDGYGGVERAGGRPTGARPPAASADDGRTAAPG